MTTAQTLSEGQLKSILDEVENELGKLVKSDLALAKARPGEDTPDEGQDDSSKTDPSGSNTDAASASPDPASASPDAAGSDSAPPAPDASASGPPADAGSAPPPDASASAGAPGGDPAMDQGPIDPQQLMAEYSKLPPEELKMHYLACKEALVQVLGAAGGDPGSAAPPPDASAGAPPPPPAAGPPPPDAGAGGPTLKAEVPSGNKLSSPGPAIGENPLHKSEVQALNAKLDATNAAVDKLVGAVKHVFEAPLRKSIVSVADIAPTAADPTKLSREQIRAKLKVVASSPTLAKSDRDLISGYDLRTVKVDQIAHLLK